MKKIGIAIDNYKLPRAEKELEAVGLTTFLKAPFSANTTFLQIEVKEEEFEEKSQLVKKILTKVELHFKRGN
jgi:hypothetical protein